MGDPATIGHETLKARQPGLDLLRTAAILLVAVFHINLEHAPRFLLAVQQCGWMGVDLFFVLSGYLIGSQLLRPYTRNAVPSIRLFFLRRAFRVLPAFLLVLIVYFLFPAFRERPNLPDLWRFLTFTLNFGLQAPAAFSHDWSLCVEEHFYLVLPFLLLWLMRKPNLRKASVVAATIFFGGLVIRFMIWERYLGPIASDSSSDDVFGIRYWQLIYFPTYSRLDGLLIGVVLAGINLFRPGWWEAAMAKRGTLLIAALITLGLAVWTSWDLYSFAAVVWGFPLIALGFGLLLLAASGLRIRVPGATMGATLAYSVYLTHKQVIHLDRIYLKGFVPLDGPLGFLVYGVTILIVGAILYVFVERPFLQMRERIISSAYSRTSGSRAVANPVGS
jgi:peptidoglycan/LPS O-acetylase OafA/YrhL